MQDESTVIGLVERFQLRGRASAGAFHAGVRLARRGLVTVTAMTPGRVRADVTDAVLLPVELYVDQGSLRGHCPCPAAVSAVCQHQVAVAHALWAARPRQPGDG